MTKPVSLTVHRNTREQRRRKDLRDHLMESARRVARRSDLNGFALVGWTDTHGVVASWDVGSVPGHCTPDFVRAGLRAKMDETRFSPDAEGPEAG